MPPDHLIELALKLTDGASVNWEAAHQEVSEADRDVLGRLRQLGELAAFHASTRAFESECLDDPLTWGPLEILDKIGRGSYGDVYTAHDPRLGRDVALKLLREPPDTSQSVLIHEGHLLTKVKHVNVVTVYGADRFGGRTGLWMELLDGETLEDELKRSGPFSAESLLKVAQDLGSAIQAVHSSGLLHRDIKAQNAIRTAEGRLVLMDFGAGSDSAGMATRALAGTPAYLAPEVLDGAAPSLSSDVYAFGVLLFHLATGTFPVEGSDLASLRRAHREGGPKRLADSRSDLTRELSAAVDRATSRDPASRFSGVGEFLEALPRAVRDRRANTRRLTVAMLAATSVLTAAGWLWHRGGGPSIPFAARDWVLVASFDNRTGDARFDDVLELALHRELINSAFVNVVPRPRIEDALTLMRKPADSPVDALLAREVALRDGAIRAVLTGSFDRVGATYVLTTNVVDPSDGRVVANVTSDVAQPSELLPQLRQQALRVRQLLGEALPTIEQSRRALEKVTTPSLPAAQLYSKAAELLEGEYWRPDPEAMKRYPDSPSRYASAEALLSQATDADPTFAAAWMLLGHVLANQNRPPREYRPFVEKAFALAGTVSPVERWMIEGFAWRYRPWHADYQELDSSVRAYEATLQLVPDHYWALLELQSLYGVLGRVNDMERVTLHAARLRPHAFRFAIDSARIRLRHGDQDGARSIVQERAAQGADRSRQLADVPPESLAWYWLWDAHLAWLNGDVRRALNVVQAVDQSSTSDHYLWLYQLANAYQGLGRYGDAERVARRMGPMQTEFFLALIASRRERWDEFRAMVHPERRDFQVLNFRVAMLVQAGWLDDAAWVFEERRRRGFLSGPNAQDDVEGQLRVAQRRYGEGLAQLERLTLGKAGPRFYVDESYAIGRRGVGDLPGAIRHLEQVGEMGSHAVAHDAWQVTGWLDCRALLAEYYVEAGRTADATRVADQVRGLLAVADADHPLLLRLARVPAADR